ncbi:TetR/AcrR family transcriptional regulator C-terminal domain-containing protein [Rhodopseudomonas palustris]|uniref:TetR/AcrR family transcriptional regulator C-terminal domain-containing protein n=1 Tax=Rhodopseudomonas palustris TaxID=1076 RepID=UPI000E5AFE49|nr:TetR/AcrR family transcriptional regulator C-terminal domain-containing protein [Rhodopseudomonas palustris]QLH71446.1 TetR/AcrR family transcriptional regulator C-terminal domain-containing protein [Rhodopseudomonas palustris]RIA02084.1 TetR family transcriptional regulator [Rhodopseudomonas palustris]
MTSTADAKSNTKIRAVSGPRGLAKHEIVETAVSLMEELGEAAFSVRKLGDRVGCDPMAILYHFKNKDGMYRAMADALVAKLSPVGNDLTWQDRLRTHARDHRALALRYPNTFPLLQRFLNTGVADFPHIEMVHRALADAGVCDADASAVCLAWYAGVIGLCTAEISGLVRPARESEVAEMEELPSAEFPVLRKLARSYLAVETETVFEIANELFIEGLCSRSDRRSD